jgi:hypothetical protein
VPADITILDRREPFAPGATAIAQDGLAAPGGIAVEKPVLPFATDLRWLILAFHKSNRSVFPVFHDEPRNKSISR